MLKSIEDIEIIDKDKILGEGAFSEVLKVRSRRDNKLYALKQVSLEDRYFQDFKGRSNKPQERDQATQKIEPPEHNPVLRRIARE